MIRFAIVAIALAGLAAFLLLLGCGARAPEPKDQAAVGLYEAELLRCVDAAHTRAEADACRADVDRRFGQNDGGAQ